MKQIYVVVLFKNGGSMKFPHSTLDLAAQTIKEFYEALGPLRPVTRWGVFHADSIAAVYVAEVDETKDVKKEVRNVRTVEDMIRSFFRVEE